MEVYGMLSFYHASLPLGPTNIEKFTHFFFILLELIFDKFSHACKYQY
jgi:hypothetical protein